MKGVLHGPVGIPEGNGKFRNEEDVHFTVQRFSGKDLHFSCGKQSNVTGVVQNYKYCTMIRAGQTFETGGDKTEERRRFARSGGRGGLRMLPTAAGARAFASRQLDDVQIWGSDTHVWERGAACTHLPNGQRMDSPERGESLQERRLRAIVFEGRADQRGLAGRRWRNSTMRIRPR
jgi:hypothetical protein